MYFVTTVQRLQPYGVTPGWQPWERRRTGRSSFWIRWSRLSYPFTSLRWPASDRGRRIKDAPLWWGATQISAKFSTSPRQKLRSMHKTLSQGHQGWDHQARRRPMEDLDTVVRAGWIRRRPEHRIRRFRSRRLLGGHDHARFVNVADATDARLRPASHWRRGSEVTSTLIT